MSTRRMRLGLYGQRLARRYLEEAGYRILAENYRCRWGEIDVVSVQGDCVVFVEVRTRIPGEYGTPEESVTQAKRERLALLAERFAQEREGLPPERRIDVIAVEVDRHGCLLHLRHIENAVA